MTFRIAMANGQRKGILPLSGLFLFSLLLHPYDLFSQNSNFPGQSPGKIDNLIIPYEDMGACPFECCAYRDWVATKDVVSRIDRKGNSPVVFRVKRGKRLPV